MGIIRRKARSRDCFGMQEPEISSPKCFDMIRLNAEMLVGDQASVIADLEIVNAKLRKAPEQKHVLEAKFQDAINENAVVKVKQVEVEKLCDQLSEAVQNVADQNYEAEKEEISSDEKEMASKLVKEIKRIYEEKIKKNKEEAERCLMQVKKEHKAMIFKIRLDCDQKEVNLHAHYREELQRIQLQAENELREKASSLRKEHEIQMKSLKMQYDDEHKRLQEDLEMQKSKEEMQRKLLQLQWEIMNENQHDNEEVNSNQEYSTSSIKSSSYRHEIVLPNPESERREMELSGYMQTPLAKLLKKANDKKIVPKHRKVTRHEYEVETSNFQAFMKHRKTRSTVMFGITSGPQSHPANICDLFSEGFLDPYTDDSYPSG